jgi:hypothetical protein
LLDCDPLAPCEEPRVGHAANQVYPEPKPYIIEKNGISCHNQLPFIVKASIKIHENIQNKGNIDVEIKPINKIARILFK